jgi:hypothetical protein
MTAVRADPFADCLILKLTIRHRCSVVSTAALWALHRYQVAKEKVLAGSRPPAVGYVTSEEIVVGYLHHFAAGRFCQALGTLLRGFPFLDRLQRLEVGLDRQPQILHP